MKGFSLCFSSLFAFLPLILASGFVSEMTVDGNVFRADPPASIKKSQPESGTAIWRISSTHPVKSTSDPSISCGPNATAPPITAAVKPGGKVSFLMLNDDLEPWTDFTGPVLAYLAACPGLCKELNSTQGLLWGKIFASGKVNGEWPAQKALSKKQPVDMTLPSNLARGNYILRTEVIDLSQAEKLNGAKFYPTCIQLNVESNQDGPSVPNPVAAFPGTYQPTDAGILDKNVFESYEYVFPGPGMANWGPPSSSTQPVPLPPAATPAPAKMVKRRRLFGF